MFDLIQSNLKSVSNFSYYWLFFWVKTYRVYHAMLYVLTQLESIMLCSMYWPNWNESYWVNRYGTRTTQHMPIRQRVFNYPIAPHVVHKSVIIYGICNAPLQKDTKRRQQYNKNKQNRLRIKVSFKMRLEYGNRGSTADVNGDGIPFQGSSHWKGCHRHICCF